MVLAFVEEVVRSGETSMGRHADPGNTLGAYAALTVDGASVRLSIDSALLSTTGGQVGDPIQRIEMADVPRFEIMVEGREPYGLRKDSIGERLGAREDLICSSTARMTMPRQFNLEPLPYLLMTLHDCGSGSLGGTQIVSGSNTHRSGTGSRSIFAKLIVAAPYVHNRSQVMDIDLGGTRDLERVHVEFRTPDGRPLRTHGRDHSLTLIFVLEDRRAGGFFG